MNTIFHKLPLNIQRFERENKIILINPEIPAWVVTNELGEVIIKLFDGTNSIDDIAEIVTSELNSLSKSDVLKFLNSVIESRIFETPQKELRHHYGLHIVHLSLSDKCNLQCKYCYAEERKECGESGLSLDEYKRIIDDIMNISPHCSFTITGGEPLLNPLWKDIAKYIKEKGGSTWLLSNGTYFNEKNIKDIKAYFDNVQISIDGSNSQIHQKTRGNNYEKVGRAIELLKSNNVNYRLAMVVCQTNIQDVENMAKKYSSNLIYQPLFPVKDDKENKLSITGLEYYSSLKLARGVVPMSNYKEMLENSKLSKCHKCAMGDGEISISATGDVYPCQLLHDEKFYAGNVKEQNIIKIYKNSKNLAYCKNLTVDKIEGCKDCAFKYICGGACRARSFYEVGDLAKSGDFCEYEKNSILDGMINLYSKNIMEL